MTPIHKSFLVIGDILLTNLLGSEHVRKSLSCSEGLLAFEIGRRRKAQPELIIIFRVNLNPRCLCYLWNIEAYD
jgi:hypothetical protein